MSGLLSLRLRDFRRFEDVTLRFQPGLNVLEGENNAGKTSVLYAIEYALYGRVGQLAPAALMRPGTRTVGVELRFVGRDEKIYRLQRIHVRPPRSRSTVHGHFTLKVADPDGEGEAYLLSSDFDDLEVDLAGVLNTALGFSKRAWELAVHNRQGKMADVLEGSSQLDMVLGVTSAVFVEEELRAMALLREKAAKALPAVEARLERFAAEGAGRRERVVKLATDHGLAESRLATLQASQQEMSERRAQLAQQEAKLEGRSAALEAKQGAQAKLEALEQGLAEAGDESVLRAKRAEATAALAPLDEQRQALAGASEALRARGEELAGLRGDVEGRLGRITEAEEGAACDHCGQVVSAEHLASAIPALESELSEVKAKAAAHESEREAHAEKQASLEAELEAARDASAAATSALEQWERANASVVAAREALQQAEDELAAASDGLADDAAEQVKAGMLALTADQATLDAQLGHAEADLERIAAEQDEAALAVKQAENEEAAARAEAESLRSDAEVAARLRALGKAFKGVQQELREGASAQMAARAFAIHKHLAGNEKEITELVIDPKRYMVKVKPTDVGSLVPAALYQGGGHRLLLGMAVKLALAERIGPVPFVLLDEPTYGLDVERKAELLDRISSLGVAEQLVLITHAELGQEGSSFQRIVRKGKKSVLMEAVQ